MLLGKCAAANQKMLCCSRRLVQRGDRLLLVSCSYDHEAPGSDVFKEYTQLAAELQVGHS